MQEQASGFEAMMIAAEGQGSPAIAMSDDFVASDPRWPIRALIGAVAVWLGLVLWGLIDSDQPITPARIAETLALASGPLALFGIAWLVVMRSSRSESDRFARTSAALRLEVATLESVIGRITERTELHRQVIAAQTEALGGLGEATEARLADISESLQRDAALLDERARQLDDAAESARTDLGVLLADLPRAEAQARSMSTALRETGLGAHEQAGALDAALSLLTARGREANEVAGSAAQRLAAHLARIEGVSEVAGRRMEEAAEQMSGAVDSSLSRAARAVDETRRALEDQSAAMLALVEQGEAAMARVGLEASAGMGKRVTEVSRQIDALSARLTEQGDAADLLFAEITKALSDIETRSTVVAESGAARAKALRAAMTQLGGQLAEILAQVEAGDAATGSLVDRAGSLATLVDQCVTELDEALPAGFNRIEQHAARAQQAAEAASPLVEALAKGAVLAAKSLEESESSAARQQNLFDEIEERFRRAKTSMDDLDRQIVKIGQDAEALTAGAGAQLVDALLRVREAGVQAAEHARETIGAVIPDSAQRLAAAASRAMNEALAGRVEQQMSEISVAANRAVDSAHKATDRLMRQMLTIAETTAAIEKRIDEAKEEVRAADGDSFSQRVAALLDSLNSTSIDVTKLLSSEVADTAWTAYLKGDRGVFTRRAVRLLDSDEARELGRHYEDDPEFRGQVNRYIHDFEAMLRDILANREGTPLGVTLLSSDMGKLYVALAQAIDRLR